MSIQLLKGFLTELELSKGKDNLIFVVFAGSPEWLEREVAGDGFEILRVELSKDDSLFKLVDLLLKWRDTEENTVYFVYGISNQFPEILSYLNLHRDFLFDVKRPVIIIGDEYAIREIATNAPDLWRFRNRTFDFLERRSESEVEFAESEAEAEETAEFIYEPIFSATAPLSTYKWCDEEVRERTELNEHLLEIISDEYRKSEICKTLAIYYLRLKKYTKSEKCFNEFLKLREGDDRGISGGYSLRAQALVGSKQFEKAIEDFDEAIKHNPNYANVYRDRGNAYRNLKQYERAIEDYNKAIELDPEYALAYNNRGIAFRNLKQYERAIEDYNKAIELDPEYALAYINRGIPYYHLKQYERAIEEYNICFDLRAKVKGKSKEIFYCGLALYLLTRDEKILEELKTLQVEDETMLRIFEFSLRKSMGEEIAEEVREELVKEEREEVKLLLELLIT